MINLMRQPDEVSGPIDFGHNTVERFFGLTQSRRTQFQKAQPRTSVIAPLRDGATMRCARAFTDRFFGGATGGRLKDVANYCVISMSLPGWSVSVIWDRPSRIPLSPHAGYSPAQLPAASPMAAAWMESGVRGPSAVWTVVSLMLRRVKSQ